MQTVPLFGVGFPDSVSQVSAQSRTNLYIRMEPEPEKGAKYTLRGTPGLTSVTTIVGGDPARGAISLDGAIYAVLGDTLYEIEPDGTHTSRGTLNTSSGVVSMAWNGTQLMIVDGTDGWIYTLATTTLSEIADAGFPANASSVCFIAARFVVSVSNSGKFYWSALLDGTSWDALDFATAESETDNLVAVASDHGSLILLGELSTEFWAPTGDSTIFTRVGGSGIEWGCVSQRTVSKFDTGLVWLAKNTLGECRVVKLNGYHPILLDDVNVTRTLNELYQAQEDADDMTALSYMLDGQHFYQLNFAERSFLYDGIGWSTLTAGSVGEIVSARHRANIRAGLSEKPYVFSYEDGSLYLMDATDVTDVGSPIVREVVTRHMFNAGNRIKVWSLQVDCEVASTEAAEPQMMMQYSRDGGKTWSSELWRGMGAIGEYFTRVIWRRLGMARDFTFKLRVTDPARVVIIGASAQVESE